MINSLAFISSKKDAEYVIALVNNSNGEIVKVVCDFPPAFKLLSEHGIDAIDSQAYISTRGRSYADYKKIVSQSQMLSQLHPLKSQLRYRQYKLGDILDYSFVLYLAEVRHSLLIAAEILRREKPQKIYLSTQFTESPMRTYQSGNLNCENIALLELAKKQGTQIVPINKNQVNDFLEVFKAIGKQLFGSLFYSIKQLTATNKKLQVPSFVFLANHYQLENLIPTIKLFMKNEAPIMAVGKVTNPLLQSITDHKIPFINYSSQLPPKTRLPDLRLILTVKYLYKWLRHRNILRAEFSRHGYWPMVKLKLFYYYLVLIPQIIETLNFADSLFDQHPKVMITTATNDVFSKCFALSARHHGTRIIEIQHGLLIIDVDAPFKCNDIYAVWGKDVAPLLDRSLPQHPKIVGYPYAANPPSRQKQKLLAGSGRQKLGISPDEKVILVLGAFPITITRFFSPVSTMGFINLLFDGISSTKNRWTIVIRPHPSYNPEWLTRLPIPQSIKLIVDQRQVPLDQEVAASDIVIANHTTTVLEALIQNKPLLMYLFLNSTVQELKSHPLLSKNVAPLFTSACELTELLDEVSKNDSHISKSIIDKFLKENFSIPAKITTAERLNNLCKQLLY